MNTADTYTPDPAATAIKLLRVTLDPAAGDGEATNAATVFARTARKAGVTFDVLTLAVAKLLPSPRPTAQPHQPKERPKPQAWWTEMPCGRHRGECLGDIYSYDPSYVKWVATGFDDDDDLRDDAAAVIRFARAGKAGGR